MSTGRHSEVLVTRGIPIPILPPRSGRSRALLVTQSGAAEVTALVEEALKSEGLETLVHVQPDGEEGKTLPAVAELWEAMAGFGILRSDVVVTVGGGSVSDAGGFAAATWLRGVEVVHVPTTLLGAVDAALGGKTGINFGGKNMVGAFWHPSRVVIDLATLEELPSVLLEDGMAECLKVGLIGDPALFELLEMSARRADLEEVVRRATAVKIAVVDSDERENGVRATLNLGHTIGHAIEYATSITHGRAVAVGLVAASAISAELLGFEHHPRVVGALEALGLPTRAPAVESEAVTQLLGLDKKRDAAGVRMVLLEDIGRPIVRHVGSVEIEIGLSAIGL